MEHHALHLRLLGCLELWGLIERISEDAQAQVVEVGTDLVGHPAVQGAVDFCPTILAPQNEEVRSGGFTIFKINPGSVGTVSIDLKRCFEGDLVPLGLGCNLRQVVLDRLTLPELAIKLAVSVRITC